MSQANPLSDAGHGPVQATTVEMHGISKSFAGNPALERVSLELARGSVHALVGENGAGKSTLMKILAGVVKADAGWIVKSGEPLRISSPKEALANGISTVFQELSLLPNLSIAENMYLGREPTARFGLVDRGWMERETERILQDLGVYVDPATLVSELSIAQRQFVEIARGISADADVIILDEPTAALNVSDVAVLNRHIHRLTAQGKSVVYISHRMDEIFEICDTVTVLKDGRTVGTHAVSEVSPQSLIAMMVGRDIENLFPSRGVPHQDTVVEIQQLRLTEQSDEVSLRLSRGEIVALAGLEGQGQREILRSITGQYRPYSGRVTVKGRSMPLPIPAVAGVRRLQSLGVGFVPEDRKDEGLFLDLSVAHNIAIGLHTSRSELAPARSYRRRIQDVMSRMAVKADGPRQPVGVLSGGNQQKVLLGRYLSSGVDVLLIEEPTRGVDVGAKAEIYKLLRDFANKGGAILVLSRETIELIGLSDRVYVVHGRRLVADMPAAEATEHRILDAALSA